MSLKPTFSLGDFLAILGALGLVAGINFVVTEKSIRSETADVRVEFAKFEASLAGVGSDVGELKKGFVDLSEQIRSDVKVGMEQRSDEIARALMTARKSGYRIVFSNVDKAQAVLWRQKLLAVARMEEGASLISYPIADKFSYELTLRSLGGGRAEAIDKLYNQATKQDASIFVEIRPLSEIDDTPVDMEPVFPVSPETGVGFRSPQRQ